MSAWEKEWKINATRLLMGNPDLAQFKIVQQGSGNSRHFTIENESGEAGECWKGCCLVPRGAKPFIYNAPDPLPTWDPLDTSVRDKYKNTIKDQLKHSNSDTNRLEGELNVGGVKHWIVLFMLRRAVEDDAGDLQDLLIALYGTKFDWSDRGTGGGPIEDGTGHGNSL